MKNWWVAGMNVFASRWAEPAYSLGDQTIENRGFEIVKVDKSPDPLVKAGTNIGLGKKGKARCVVTQAKVCLCDKNLD